MRIFRNSDAAPAPRDPYRGVVYILVAAGVAGCAATVFGSRLLASPVLLAAAIALGLAVAIPLRVALVQAARSRPVQTAEPAVPATDTAVEPGGKLKLKSRFAALGGWLRGRLRKVSVVAIVEVLTPLAGVAAVVYALRHKFVAVTPTLPIAGIAAGVCLVGAALAAIAARYLADIGASEFPEATGLSRGGRVLGWILLLAALSIGLQWFGLATILRLVFFLILAIDLALSINLAVARFRRRRARMLDLAVLTVLGSRANVLAGILDSGERQLGIDLRSTWALTVVRNGMEPLLIGLFLVGWLSTSLTVVAPEEQGLVERLGVPVGGAPLMPGLHLHLPWPMDRVARIPVLRVQQLLVGHEGDEKKGPEDVLWARAHAANEFTLLLGNGRDLITVDASVQFRIADPRAWRYHCQNPADALKAIAYRAVMRSTVNRTLADALSENVGALTSQMRASVQRDADALGLGIEVVSFTLGGMHPPVAVAADYQAVVSAEIRKVTAAVNAQAFRNKALPEAEAAALVDQNTARATGAEALGAAAGEAWGFRALESQYRAAPEEYFFRRRLETLESGLKGRRYTIIDSRIERDGGQIWVIP